MGDEEDRSDVVFRATNVSNSLMAVFLQFELAGHNNTMLLATIVLFGFNSFTVMPHHAYCPFLKLTV